MRETLGDLLLPGASGWIGGGAVNSGELAVSRAAADQLERYGTWWERALFGETVFEIAQSEQARGSDVTAEAIERGICDFAGHATHCLFGNQRVAHISFARAAKRTLHREIARALRENDENSGRGRVTLDTVVVTNASNEVEFVRTRKKFVRADVTAMIKLLAELDRYEAIIDGAIGGESLPEEPIAISVDVESFLEVTIRDPQDKRFDATRCPLDAGQDQFEQIESRSSGVSP